MADTALDASYWNQDATGLAATFGGTIDGLASEHAVAQLAAVGPNSVEDAPRLSALRLLLRQFESPLVLILAFAAAISLVLQQWVDAGIILAIVLGSSLLNFFQEYTVQLNRPVEPNAIRGRRLREYNYFNSCS